MSLTKCAQHSLFRSILSLAVGTLEQESQKIFSRFLVFDRGTHKGRSDKVIKKVQGKFWIRKKVRTKGETFFTALPDAQDLLEQNSRFEVMII